MVYSNDKELSSSIVIQQVGQDLQVPINDNDAIVGRTCHRVQIPSDQLDLDQEGLDDNSTLNADNIQDDTTKGNNSTKDTTQGNEVSTQHITCSSSKDKSNNDKAQSYIMKLLNGPMTLFNTVMSFIMSTMSTIFARIFGTSTNKSETPKAEATSFTPENPSVKASQILPLSAAPTEEESEKVAEKLVEEPLCELKADVIDNENLERIVNTIGSEISSAMGAVDSSVTESKPDSSVTAKNVDDITKGIGDAKNLIKNLISATPSIDNTLVHDLTSLVDQSDDNIKPDHDAKAPHRSNSDTQAPHHSDELFNTKMRLKKVARASSAITRASSAHVIGTTKKDIEAGVHAASSVSDISKSFTTPKQYEKQVTQVTHNTTKSEHAPKQRPLSSPLLSKSRDRFNKSTRIARLLSETAKENNNKSLDERAKQASGVIISRLASTKAPLEKLSDKGVAEKTREWETMISSNKHTVRG